MTTYILIINLLLFLSASEVYAGILSGLIHALIEEPPKPEDYSDVKCKRTCYRSFNGSCNNLKHPSWGAAGTLFTRLFDSYSYHDGKCEMPHLTNPRKISLDFVDDCSKIDPERTLFLLPFGQYLAHEMALSSGAPQSGAQAISCPCVDGKLKKMNSMDQKCAPIKIPKWDPYNTPDGVECFDFVRTRSTCDECTSMPGEQFNAVTSFIDCSPIYGNNEELANKLRKFKHGMLDYVMIDDRMYPPQAKDPRTCNAGGTSRPLCIFTGDFRGNQNPHIALMQIILLRNHNRIAKGLHEINPHWCDERIYQEARRINIAIVQCITYDDYLPNILGLKNMIKCGIKKPDVLGFLYDDEGYDPEVDPSVYNEYTTAANRGFHSSISGKMELFDEKRKPCGTVILSKTFNNVSILLHRKTEERMCIGAGTQNQMATDRHITDDATKRLFVNKEGKGEDLYAFDIFRGRDHGLATFSTAMKECGICTVKSFDDYHKVMSPGNVKILKRHYKCYEDVELIVGGLLEFVPPGQLIGKTFSCIICQQFRNTKFGDYYFYKFKHKCSFNEEQIKEIDKQTMAKLVCHNVGGIPIQPKAFEVPSPSNKVVPCSELPFIDLTKWAENPDHKSCCSGD